MLGCVAAAAAAADAAGVCLETGCWWSVDIGHYCAVLGRLWLDMT